MCCFQAGIFNSSAARKRIAKPARQNLCLWLPLNCFVFFVCILAPISNSCIGVSVFDHQGSSSNCLVNPSISISSVAILNKIVDFAEPPLSSAHPDFKDTYDFTYTRVVSCTSTLVQEPSRTEVGTEFLVYRNLHVHSLSSLGFHTQTFLKYF